MTTFSILSFMNLKNPKKKRKNKIKRKKKKGKHKNIKRSRMKGYRRLAKFNTSHITVEAEGSLTTQRRRKEHCKSVGENTYRLKHRSYLCLYLMPVKTRTRGSKKLYNSWA
jgi:hypothetical protein